MLFIIKQAWNVSSIEWRVFGIFSNNKHRILNEHLYSLVVMKFQHFDGDAITQKSSIVLNNGRKNIQTTSPCFSVLMKRESSRKHCYFIISKMKWSCVYLLLHVVLLLLWKIQISAMTFGITSVPKIETNASNSFLNIQLQNRYDYESCLAMTKSNANKPMFIVCFVSILS